MPDNDQLNNFSDGRFLSTLDPALLAAVMVALAGFAGIFVGVFLVGRFPRKKLLLCSAAGTALAFFALSGHFFTQEGKCSYGTSKE